MSNNQLTVPFKRTDPLPIKTSLRKYIETKHPETHPDAFKWDISKWESSRKDGVSGEVHESRIEKTIAYHAQLVFLLAKLPTDVGLPVTYDAVFPSSSQPPLSLNNLQYERACVLFNLASLFCQLASAEDRATGEGITRAMSYYSKAAGTVSYLLTKALPAFRASLNIGNQELPADLHESFLKGLEQLFLAQAQECTWQKSVMANHKNSVIAKLAAQASQFYAKALGAARESSAVANNFPKDWLPHMETKMYHFEAAAQLRQSMDDADATRYGLEIARIGIAQTAAKKAADVARRGGVSRAVQDDVKSLVTTLATSWTRAHRDNDMIYHQDVPPASSTPAVVGRSVVAPVILPTLSDPPSAIGGDKSENVIFGGLEGWGVRRACEIYEDRRENFLQDEIVDCQHELDTNAANELQSMNLPASLDALSQPIGLPPSLLRKVEEVRSEDGPNRVTKLMEDIPRLAANCRRFIDEALDLLDEEATEDEEYRRAYEGIEEWTRPSSEVANANISSTAAQYHQLLNTAAESDAGVRRVWDEWETRIEVLAQTEAEIEAAVPKTTMNANSTAPQRSHTQTQARGLRKLLEELEDLQISRSSIVAQAKRLVVQDDIKPRILRQANGLERWTEVDPAMFESIIDDELSKYDRFKDTLQEGREQQEGLISRIKDQNETFLRSRKEDPAIKERERALQSLDIAYSKYREVVKNLEDGLKFYNGMAAQLSQFNASSKDWVRNRRAEVSWITESLNERSMELEALPEDPPPVIIDPQPQEAWEAPEQAAPATPVKTPPKVRKGKAKATAAAVSTPLRRSARNAAPETESKPARIPSPPPTPAVAKPIIAFGMPNPNSAEWEETPMFVPTVPRGEPVTPKPKTRKKALA